MTKIIEHLPEILQNIREFNVLNEVLQEIIDDLWKQQEWLYLSYYINDKTPNEIIEMWENALQIISKKSESIEERLFRLHLYTSTKAPYTLSHLDQFLKEECTYYSISIDYEKLILDIQIGVENWDKYNIIFDYVDKIIPANLVRKIREYYNIWNEIKDKKWGEMKTKTWKEVKEDRGWVT